MTTNLTVATANGKIRVAFCKLFCSETKSGKLKREFYDLQLATFCGETNRPQVELEHCDFAKSLYTKSEME